MAAFGTQPYWEQRFAKMEAAGQSEEWMCGFEGPLRTLVAQCAAPQARVLHLGAGLSRVPLQMAAAGYSAQTSVDYTEAAARQMRALAPEIEFIHADAREVPLPDDSVDLCIDKGMLDPLFFIEDQERAATAADALLAEAARLLAPWGSLLSVTIGRVGDREYRFRQAGWSVVRRELVKEASATQEACHVYLLRRQPELDAARFNFGPASALDEQAFACMRPGRQACPAEEPGATPDEAVDEWLRFVRARGVRRVVSLLGDDEAAWYATPIDEAMAAAGLAGYARTSVFAEGAADVVRAACEAARDAGERVVFHCSGGSGRAALGVGVWLHVVHSLSPAEAAAAVATGGGVHRRPDGEKLERFLAGGSL